MIQKEWGYKLSHILENQMIQNWYHRIPLINFTVNKDNVIKWCIRQLYSIIAEHILLNGKGSCLRNVTDFLVHVRN